jgi:hypothetical protein
LNGSRTWRCGGGYGRKGEESVAGEVF